MKATNLITIILAFAFTSYGQQNTGPSKNQGQRLNEIRNDLIVGSVKSFGRVGVSPARFKWRQWAVVAVAGGLVANSFSSDNYVFSEARDMRGTFTEGLSSYVGEPFGNPWVATGTTLGIYLLGKGFDCAPVAEPALVAFQSVVIGGASSFVLKLLFHRQRPREGLSADPWVWYGPSFRNENLSFPSGHTTTAFALASALIGHYHEKKWVAFVALPLAAITAWSRVYDNEHWYSDVVAGAVLGSFIGYTVSRPKAYSWSVLPNGAAGLNLSFSYHF